MRHKKTRFSRRKGRFKWRAKGKKGLTRSGLIRIRTVPEALDLKTAVLVDKKLIPKEKRKNFAKQFKNKKRKIPSNRPIASIARVDKKGRPTHVRTPQGSLLEETGNLGCFNYFSNKAVVKKLKFKENEKPKDSFYDSTSYQAVKAPKTIKKSIKKKITAELLKKTSLEIEKNKGKRSISQAKAMVEPGVGEKKAAATDYAKATGNFADVRGFRWEWLHLIAHSFIGKEGQIDLNLVCGSAFANTNMMFVEEEIRYLISKYPDGFELEVNAELIEETHVATKIEYTITTSDFSIPFSFKPQTNIKPDIVVGDYTHCLVESVVDTHDDKSSSLVVAATPSKPTPVQPVPAPVTVYTTPQTPTTASMFMTPNISPIFMPEDSPSFAPPIKLMTPVQLLFNSPLKGSGKSPNKDSGKSPIKSPMRAH